MNPMFLKVIIVSLVSLLIGALAFATLNKKSKREKSKERNTKLSTYVFITLIIFVSIAYLPLLLYIITAFLILIALREILSASGHSRIRSFAGIAIGGIILYSFAHFIKNSPPDTLLFTYFIVVHFDSFSQIIGESFGKRKMIPKISPEKTWEGFFGGVIVALMAGFSIFLASEPLMTITQVSLIVASAFLGDVLASYFKRVCGVKNFSNLIPGHGGVLDRFDSFFMAGAVIQALQWFYTH